MRTQVIAKGKCYPDIGNLPGASNADSVRHRVELDVGKKNHLGGNNNSADDSNGPAAVIRNLDALFGKKKYEGRRLVVTDRYYTSVPLAQQLRTMGFTFCGTFQTIRLGWCKEVEFSVKKRKTADPRGEFKMATAISDPSLVACGWMDNRPVYFLSSHVSAEKTTIQRREKNGSISTVPCPHIVRTYQKYMGGVDKHDQLRLQSYSLQLSTR